MLNNLLQTKPKASTPTTEKTTTTTTASTPAAEIKAPAASETKPVETKSEPVKKVEEKKPELVKVEEKKPEPKAAETAKPVEEKKPVIAEAAPVKKEEVKSVAQETKKEVSEKVVESSKPPVETLVAVAPEEPKKAVETPAAAPEEPKKEAEAPAATEEAEQKVVEETKAVENTETEEKKTEAPATSSVPAPTPAPVPAAAESKPEESAEVTLSHLIATVNAATPVKDVFTFPYPEGSVPPDPKLQKSKRLKYDPKFLLQFQPKCVYKIDEEWGKKYAVKIVIPDMPKRSDTRGGDRGGFGGRSNSQYNRDPRNPSGPGGMSRTSTLRNSEYAGRSGSRGGSRKKMGQGREKSQRQNSRRPRGDGRDNRGERRERTHEGSRRGAPKEEEPPAPVAPLVKSATRWVPASRKQEKKEVKYAPDGVTVIYDEETLSSKVKSLLNKLTLERFDEITDELVALANQSKWETEGESLKTVIELTFAKACDEQFWSSMYAKFCLKLCKVIDPEVRVKSVEAQLQSHQDPSKVASSIVRRLLLTRCQFEFG
ncbi:unnamed protein product [Ambrosiozyma monospora]|uniref:Unnamed protein product n=1 Tax=Ambrosiozyma monospora TaxID=43982 RepID=A0ACB5T3Z5_AMBMO|nr:unnamed protein product [Ambrosiozyma monospora]